MNWKITKKKYNNKNVEERRNIVYGVKDRDSNIPR